MMQHTIQKYSLTAKNISALALLACLVPSAFALSHDNTNLDKKSSIEKQRKITVYNDLAIERANETVTVSFSLLIAKSL